MKRWITETMVVATGTHPTVAIDLPKCEILFIVVETQGVPNTADETITLCVGHQEIDNPTLGPQQAGIFLFDRQYLTVLANGAYYLRTRSEYNMHGYPIELPQKIYVTIYTNLGASSDYRITIVYDDLR